MQSIPSTVRLVKAIVVAATIVWSLITGAAMADVVVVVSTMNPVSTLSNLQVVDIFLGRVSRFPDGILVVAIDQVEGSKAREEFYSGIADMSPAQLKAHWSKIIFTGRGRPPEAVSDSSTVKTYISQHPNAIGYIERSHVDNTVKMLIVH